jgi:hypothetical protein
MTMKKSVALILAGLVSLASFPAAAADDTMYLDTALRDGWQIKGQSSVTFIREEDGVDTPFSRLEVIVTKGKEFAMCAIETNLDKTKASEMPCSTFK